MNKAFWKSKTIWMGLIAGLLPIFPEYLKVIVDNPAEVSMVWGALAIVLRLVTKEKVVLVE